MTNELILSSEGTLLGALSDEDERTLQLKLWRLLSRQTEMYTMGDSSSVRIETAQALLESIQFCLNLYLKKSGNTKELLVTSDLDELFALGIKAVEEQIETGKQLYHAACVTAPEIDNISYKDTLIGIGGFFKHYDYRYFAQTISCDFDYQLCHAVEDSYQGIEFINEYLRRIIIENDFVRHFDHDRAIRLLESHCSDYRGLLINIYEPLAANAIGLALLHENVGALCVAEADRLRLKGLFETMSETPAKKALKDAARRVCSDLEIRDKAEEKYLLKTAEELYPRIEAALPHGNLGGVFLSC